MEAPRFDTFARALAAVKPRRSLLSSGAFAALLALFSPDVTRADKKGAPKKACCRGAGCLPGRCRCTKGWARCGKERRCRNLATDANHCGGCGQACAGGCCIAGVCQSQCGATCCADCFKVAQGTNIFLGTEACCAAAAVCDSGTGDPADDLCCWPNETCIAGKCCCDGCEGTVVCGGVCCPSVSCCNGACCGPGQVCAKLTPNGPLQCVDGDRSCGGNGDCAVGEECRGGICCSGDRLCFNLGPPKEPTKCCPVGEYCDVFADTCCAVGGICGTAKKVRIRA